MMCMMCTRADACWKGWSYMDVVSSPRQQSVDVLL